MKTVGMFIGGPWDGVRKSMTDPPDWAWLGGDLRFDRVPRLHRKGAAGREPYKVESTVRRKGKPSVRFYLYAGHEFVLCSGCGCVHARRTKAGAVKACTLCGGDLAVPA